MTWSKLDEEKRLCNEWLQEPLVNPSTGRAIERNGPTFKSWMKRCKEIGSNHRPTATHKMTWRKCQEWKRSPTINPDTGRKILRGGPKYKWLKKQCSILEEKDLILEGEYYVPDKKGMVPSILYRGTYYVVRIFDSRKVWGPLNKPARTIQLVYYADTWDYHYNHYNPIYRGKPPPKKFTKTVVQKGSSKWLTTEPKLEKNDPKYVVDDIVDFFIK